MQRLAPYAVLTIVISGFLLASAGRRAEAVCDGTCIPLTEDQVATAAYSAGFRGGALVYSIAIAKAESDFQLNAINNANLNGSTDYGLWQVNSIHVNNPPHYDANRLLNDASYNAMAAYEISSAGINWCPWVTFWNQAFVTWLSGVARPAAQAIDSTVIRPITEEFSRVSATRDVNMRMTAGGSLLRTVAAGTTGTVVEGPQVQSFETCPNAEPHYYIWWKIHWDDGGEDGWSVEDAMARIYPSAQEFTLAPGWNSISHTFSFPVHFDTGEVRYQGETKTISEAVDSGWLYYLVHEWVDGNWQTFDIRSGIAVPGHTYWVYAYVDGVILALPDPNSIDPVDRQAILDMENRGAQDGRFLSLILGTFGKDLNWDPNWELRWIDFHFIGSRVVRMYHITAKINSSVRHTIFWDPDANSWNGWTPAM